MMIEDQAITLRTSKEKTLTEHFWEIADETKMTAAYQIDSDLLKLRTASLSELKQVFLQYRFFTIYYIQDLALLSAKLPFGALRSAMAEFLNEELGNGNEHHAHPTLYDDFLLSLGVSHEDLTRSNSECIELLAKVQKSLLTRSWAYGIGLRGMGGECLCQIYLSSMYAHFMQNPLIIERSKQLSWKFWEIHTGEVDIEHRLRTKAAINSLIENDPLTVQDLRSGYLESKEAWDLFWKAIFRKAFYEH
jgi:hypothetical protein